MDISEKIMAIETEIIDGVKEENNNQIEKKREELKKEYDSFQKELEKRRQKILNDYKTRAKQKREQIISRAILKKKNLRRKKMNELINNFIQDLHDQLNNFTNKKDYCLFIFNSIKKAANQLPDKDFIVLLRKKDHYLKSDLEELLEEEMNDYYFEIRPVDKIKSGGFIIKSQNKNQLIENTFNILIDSFKEEIAIELKNNILT